MWVDMLLGRKQAQENSTEELPPWQGATAQYSPTLISELRDEHRTLVDSLDQIGRAYSAGNMTEIPLLLENFGGLLTAHLLKEDFRLYVYLERGLAWEPQSHGVMRDHRIEMERLGKNALAFLSKYRNISARPDLLETFGPDLAEFAKLLQERISREEQTLYPIYRPGN